MGSIVEEFFKAPDGDPPPRYPVKWLLEEIWGSGAGIDAKWLFDEIVDLMVFIEITIKHYEIENGLPNANKGWSARVAAVVSRSDSLAIAVASTLAEVAVLATVLQLKNEAGLRSDSARRAGSVPQHCERNQQVVDAIKVRNGSLNAFYHRHGSDIRAPGTTWGSKKETLTSEALKKVWTRYQRDLRRGQKSGDVAAAASLPK